MTANRDALQLPSLSAKLSGPPQSSPPFIPKLNIRDRRRWPFPRPLVSPRARRRTRGPHASGRWRSVITAPNFPPRF